MYQTTKDWLTKRALGSGLTIETLALEPDGEAYYEISISYGDKADEKFFLGETMYEVNIADWLAEQCRDEAQLEFAVYGEIRRWSVEVWDVDKDVQDPHYRVASDS